MRKLIASINITMDGFMAGPNAELDWHFQYWNEEMAAYACRQLSEADVILLGRETYEVMAGYWPFIANSACFARDDIPFAEMMNDKKKLVFSRTMKKLGWNNSELAHGRLQPIILDLKKSRGANMILYGSRSLLSDLTRFQLVDEYVLWLHPLVIRSGLGFYNSFSGSNSFTLLESKVFRSGVVLLHYKADNKFNHQNVSNMEQVNLSEDIRVFYVQASSFPAGIEKAYQDLHAKLPIVKDRTFYGISYPDETGNIQYKAAVKELRPGEGKEYGLDNFLIPKGKYLSETIDDWRNDIAAIGRTFQQMLKDPKIDKNGFCLEIYEGEKAVRCLVRLGE